MEYLFGVKLVKRSVIRKFIGKKRLHVLFAIAI
ncbi:hypothetical protein SAMN05444359_14010 [Neolewinella agarilytica]|uniref:Uncharacterized protein n=1 Tax=Neolewinella agarilytica TaxID=478744 RepID=A0A1H9NVN8_9BACT|nr:hypothetical protein SAMN05444359_14010 [Neolewinella agarilytica]